MKEFFQYSLMTSGLGIIVVFLILILLSVFMVLIRYFSDEIFGPEKVTQDENKQESHPADQELPRWVSAAVAVFSSYSDPDTSLPTASAWAPSETERHDRWLEPARRTDRNRRI